jgi:Holliday junction resolvasome RuvABC ATP-dependent DNA helicase subunit
VNPPDAERGSERLERTELANAIHFFGDLIGQTNIVTRLRRLREFTKSRGGPFGHILLIGEDGMGKATIAATVANELDVGFQVADVAEIKIQGDLTAILTNLHEGQVLMLPNVQKLRKPLVEKLHRALRDYKLVITIGDRNHVMELRPFTVIATCPKRTDCPAELLGQFSLVLELQPYSKSDLQLIAVKVAEGEGVTLDLGAAELIASGCDGSTGHLQVILQRLIRSLSKSAVSEEDVLQAFTALGINPRLAPPKVASKLQDLSGIDFERLIASLLARMGFQAEMTKTTGDGGIDIIASLDRPVFGGRYLFQCKRFAPDNLVGAPTVRDFYGAVTADRAVKGVLITTSEFTVQAREFGERVGVELIALGQLKRLLVEYGLEEALGE